jgi:hypothetical protein
MLNKGGRGDIDGKTPEEEQSRIAVWSTALVL